MSCSPQQQTDTDGNTPRRGLACSSPCINSAGQASAAFKPTHDRPVAKSAQLRLVPVQTTRVPTAKGPERYCVISVPCIEEYFDEGDKEELAVVNDTRLEHLSAATRWSRCRAVCREAFAEFLGVMLLIIFSDGSNAQVFLSADSAVALGDRGTWLSTNIACGIGAALGVWVSGGVSGGHINPAVTIALATFRGFPWRKVPIYIFAQTLGGICGAGIVYANYIHAIDLVEGGRHVRTLATARLFAPYAAPYMTNVSCFFDEFLGTAILLICVFAFTDKYNGPPPAGLVPLAIFFLIVGLGSALGSQTGYALNPARDLGPRILTAMVGYGSEVFTYRHHYWLWCPIAAPILGAIVGAFIYDAMIFPGPESVLNRPNPNARNAVPRDTEGASFAAS